MSYILAKDEEVVKDWQYATTSDKQGESQYSLTVTNKRIIVHEEAKNYAHYEELPVADVKRVESTYCKKRNPIGIVLMLIGLALLVAGAVLIGLGEGAPEEIVMLVAGILLTAGGVLAYIFLSQAQLVVYIYSVPADEGLDVSANSIRPLFKRHRYNDTTRVKVNPEVANEIVTTLGSLILVK